MGDFRIKMISERNSCTEKKKMAYNAEKNK